MVQMRAIIEVQKLIAQLRAKAAKSIKDDNASVVVGYSTGYALYVHENLQAHHAPGKEAKYLEGPARRLADDGTLTDLTAQALVHGKTMAQGLLAAGLRLQRESQEIVPVDTGQLKNSAFTVVE
jgi:hypothetical protein